MLLAPDGVLHAQLTSGGSVPFDRVTQWLNFTRADLDRITVKTGQLDFSTRYVYEGDLALRWRYQPGDSLTWKCKEDNLGNSPTFYFTALEPRGKDQPGSTFRIEFLDAKGEVGAHCEMPLVRTHWNRCIIHEGNPISDYFCIGVPEMVGSIPKTVSSVRVTPVADQAGELYLGGWFLIKDGLLRRGNTAELDGFPKAHEPDGSAVPEPTAAETTAIAGIRKQLEEGLMADWFNNLNRPYAAIVAEVTAHYQELNLRRTAEGMTGRNVIMEGLRRDHRSTGNNAPPPEKLQLAAYNALIFPKNTLHPYGDFGNSAHAYCALMLDVANCYRREADAGRKAQLLAMYAMMFDYSLFVGGFPATWFDGEGYVESIFLMHKELIASDRLAPSLLNLLKQQIRFDRIFLEHSISNSAHPSDSGEDCDYTRITSERLIYLVLMEPNPRLRTEDLHAFQRWFSRVVLAYSPGIRDTFKPDGSTNHHGGIQYGYGSGAIATCARVIHLFARTPFAVEPIGHTLFKKLLMQRRCFCSNGSDPSTLSGKEGIGRGNTLAAWPYLLMALSGTPDGREPVDRDLAAAYLRLYSEKKEIPHVLHDAGLKVFAQEKIVSEPVPQGHWTLGWSAAAVHRHNDWLLSVRGYSRYAYSRESGHKTVYHVPQLGFGTLELLSPADYNRNTFQYFNEFSAPGFDFTKFPGTTAVFLPLEKLAWKGDWRHRGDQSFVGGVDAPDGSGVFTLSLHGPKKVGLDSFYAHKSWFFFGNTIVCLGTGIRDQIADAETGTTLFQDTWNEKSATPLYWNSLDSLKGFPLEKGESLTSPHWLINRQGIGFYLYPGQQLKLSRSEHRFQLADDKGPKSSVGKFTTAWLSHGSAPQNASYRYLMRVGVNPESMTAFSKEMSAVAPYEILQQDDAAHIAASKSDASEGCVIYKADTALNARSIVSASKPCVVLARRTATKLTVSVADPDLNFIDQDKDAESWGYSQPSSIQVTLRGRWQGEVGTDLQISYPSPEQTTVTVGCKDGLTSRVSLRPAS